MELAGAPSMRMNRTQRIGRAKLAGATPGASRIFMPATVPAVRLRPASTTARVLRFPHCRLSSTSNMRLISFGGSTSRTAAAGKVPSDEDRRKAPRSVAFSAMVDKFAIRPYSAHETGMELGSGVVDVDGDGTGTAAGLCRGARAVRYWIVAALAKGMCRSESDRRRRSREAMGLLKDAIRAIATVIIFFFLVASGFRFILLFYPLHSSALFSCLSWG